MFYVIKRITFLFAMECEKNSSHFSRFEWFSPRLWCRILVFTAVYAPYSAPLNQIWRRRSRILKPDHSMSMLGCKGLQYSVLFQNRQNTYIFVVREISEYPTRVWLFDYQYLWIISLFLSWGKYKMAGLIFLDIPPQYELSFLGKQFIKSHHARRHSASALNTRSYFYTEDDVLFSH